jgi:hypothetical protein
MAKAFHQIAGERQEVFLHSFCESVPFQPSRPFRLPSIRTLL